MMSRAAGVIEMSGSELADMPIPPMLVVVADTRKDEVRAQIRRTLGEGVSDAVAKVRERYAAIYLGPARVIVMPVGDLDEDVLDFASQLGALTGAATLPAEGIEAHLLVDSDLRRRAIDESKRSCLERRPAEGCA